MTILLDSPTRTTLAPTPALMPRQMPQHPAVDRYGMASHKVVLPPKPVVFCLDPADADAVLAACQATAGVSETTVQYLRDKIAFAAAKAA